MGNTMTTERKYSGLYTYLFYIEFITWAKAVFLRLSAIADHLRKIPQSRKCIQVNRRNIPVVKVTIFLNNY
jgi:hypothetical protein